MNANALVSIIIPAYKATWFELALKSALAQDYPHCEIIIGDDCPDAKIEDIVTACQETSRFPIHYQRHRPALGEIANLSQAISRAKGEYVKFLYDDDVLLPQAVSQLVAALSQVPQAVMATARRNRIDSVGKAMADEIYSVSPVLEDTIFHGQDMARWQADFLNNFIGEPSAVLVRSAALRKLVDEPRELHALIDEGLPFIADLVIYLRLLRHGHLVYLPQVLAQIRISREQTSQEARLDGNIASQSHQRFPEEIKKLGWYDEQLPQGWIRHATLRSQQDFQPFDLTTALQNARVESHFAEWFRQRTLRPIEQQLIAQHLASQPVARIAVVIDVRDATETEWLLTQASLDVAVAGLSLQPVVLAAPYQSFIPASVQRIDVRNNQVVAALNTLTEEGHFDWLIVLRAGSQLYTSGLQALGTVLPEVGHCQLIYADEVYPVNGRPVGASFRPDFNLDLLLSNPSRMACHWLFRREFLQQTGGFATHWPGCFELDVILRTIESQPFNVIGHLAEPLVQTASLRQPVDEERALIRTHLQHRGYAQADVSLSPHNVYQLHYGHPQSAPVSIIVLVSNHLPNLVSCVTSLMEKTASQNYELLLVSAQGGSAAQDEWLRGIAEIDPARIRTLQIEGGFHRARMVNAAAAVARGDYLLLLSSDLAMLDNSWLENLLNHAQRPEVAIVGARQIYANGQVRHAGYVLGINGLVGEPFYGESHETAGHMARLQADQNYSAVSGDLMMVRTEVFRAVEGLDETLQHFDDVDFCLRVREAGLMTVWTPYVRMLRQVNPELTIDTQSRSQEEDRQLQKWQAIVTQDPAYNPNLTLNNINFSVSSDSELTWRPLSWRPLPVVMPFMADFAGCGYYRIIKPYEAMRDAGLVDGKLSSTLINVAELNRFAPDSLIFQRRIDAEFHEWLEKVSKHTQAFKIYELDDYLPNIPLKNHHRSQFGNDVKKLMRRSLSYMDRFVVSTEPLAEAFADMHHDIVVRKNRLSHDWWGKLQSLRNQGKKPRVGWAGGSSHTGDLEMIVDVVRHFANDVEWVFFGMCPPKLWPFIHEYHHGVEIERYPAKLASLNLDLALAPVEDNFFNTCKSNLRLMEYGACGIPVICSDVACYRGDLTVTRVKNRHKDWVDAINMHLLDPAASAQMGARLQQEIRQDWMLEGENLQSWSQAWTLKR